MWQKLNARVLRETKLVFYFGLVSIFFLSKNGLVNKWLDKYMRTPAWVDYIIPVCSPRVISSSLTLIPCHHYYHYKIIIITGVISWCRHRQHFHLHHHMCCDLARSVRSREHWFWDTSRKRNAFLLFSSVLRIFQLL